MASTTLSPALLNRLRMRQVTLLLAIEVHGTLHAASTALGMTQPAATKMLHALEDTLGQTLFDRIGRGLQINSAGLCVTHYFKGLRGSMQVLTRELEALRLGSAGKLLIGSIMAASPAHLTDALIRLKTLFPLMAVEIAVGTSDRLMEQLHEGVLDLVIGRLPALGNAGMNPDYAFAPIADEALSVVVSIAHPLADGRQVIFKDLLHYPWILQPTGSPMREVIEQEFKARHVPLPRGLIETASILTTTNLIARTEMIAVIPQSIAGRYAQHGLLRIVPYAISHHLAAYGSIVRKDRPVSAAAQAFLELLHVQEPRS